MYAVKAHLAYFQEILLDSVTRIRGRPKGRFIGLFILRSQNNSSNWDGSIFAIQGAADANRFLLPNPAKGSFILTSQNS